MFQLNSWKKLRKLGKKIAYETNNYVNQLEQAGIMFKRKLKWQLVTKNFTIFKTKAQDLEQIVRNNIEKNFDVFYSPSTGHFKGFFYMRDFWWVADSLKNLGYEKEAKQSLEFILNQYMKHNKITTTVRKNNVFDYPNKSMDSLPALIDVIHTLDYKLNDLQVQFIKNELEKYYENIEDHLVTPKRHFSTLSDHKIRYSDIYSNSMYFLLTKRLKELNDQYGYGFRIKDNPENIKEAILDNLYNVMDGYFYDDIKKKPMIVGDAQIFPFKVGVLEDAKAFKKAIKHIYENKLNDNLALRYHNPKLFKNYNIFKHIKNILFDSREYPKYHFTSILCYRYQTDLYWALLGINYLDTLMKFHKKTNDPFFLNELKKETNRWKEMIEFYGDMFEIYKENDEHKKVKIIYKVNNHINNIIETVPKILPYSGLFYFSDNGMIWQAKVLEAKYYVKYAEKRLPPKIAAD